jgi:hypothetical protein
MQEPCADSSIGNITGSNSVNVFFGLGLPWALAAFYWRWAYSADAEAKWRARFEDAPWYSADMPVAFVVEAAELGFSVLVFSLTALPCLGVLVLRESRDALPALQADQLKPEQKKLVQWLSRSIPGAPVTVDSCATSFSSGVSLAAGLPAFQRISTEQAAGSGDTAALCSSQDPQALFDTMMKYGAALYIMGTPPEGSAGEAEQAEGGIDGRPDLFAKVYDRDGLKVFAASFSNLYRRPAHS